MWVLWWMLCGFVGGGLWFGLEVQVVGDFDLVWWRDWLGCCDGAY